MDKAMLWLQMLQLLFILWIAVNANIFLMLTKTDRIIGVLVVGFAIYYTGKSLFKDLIDKEGGKHYTSC